MQNDAMMIASRSAIVSIVHKKKKCYDDPWPVGDCVYTRKKYLRMTPYFLDNMMMMTVP